ncbi:Uncharacterized protein Adt_41339 [Abeliophyllum distichum]|uniref:Uncharacterized protein n=1 Tax=Abeliophyllum distichum TaxID=126358 RepID=A0ABD1PQ36_9LAMI
MSSVHHRRFPNEFWKVKNRDMAVEEIIRERRVAIMSGKLKGRQLFEAVERASEVELDWNDDELCSDCLNMLQEREVNNENLEKNKEDFGTYFRPACSFSNEKAEISEMLVVEGKKKVGRGVEEKGGASRNLRGGERCMSALAWFAIVSMLFTLGLIISMSCSGNYVHEKEVILIPT